MTFAIWKAKYNVRLGEDGGAAAELPVITHLPNGGYVVAWKEGAQLKLKIYNGAGDTNGTIHSVETTTAAGNYIDIQPIGSNGDFALGWNAGQTPNADLRVRVFTHHDDGTYTGGTVQTVQSNTTGSLELPSIVARPDGSFISTYTNGQDVFFQLHAADGNK